MKVSLRYKELREQICARAANRSHSLERYLQDREGLFPTEAIATLIDLDKGGDKLRKLKINQSNISDNGDRVASSFLRSSWDFSEETATYIAEKIKFSERVLHLGTPMVANKTSACTPEQQNILIDVDVRRHETENKYLFIQHDINSLLGTEFPGAFDACIFDPPWYLELYIHWLKVAVHSCRKDGIVIFPLFGRLTRPSASVEREKILGECSRMAGSVEIIKGKADYKIPSFERRILERSDIYINTWKKADLIILRNLSRNNHRHAGKICVPAPVIETFSLGGHVLEMAMDRHVDGVRSLWEEPDGGYAMPSPSMRDAGNKASNVFIENGTRVICNRPLDALAIMRRISRQDLGLQLSELSEIEFPTKILDL